MPSINTEVYVGYIDVDVDLEDFETEDLKAELARRNESAADYGYTNDLLKTLYEKRRAGQNFDYELDQILYESIGRIS